MTIRATIALLQVLHQGISGVQSANMLVDTTIATVNSQTSFTLTDGSAVDDAYNDYVIVLLDASDGNATSPRVVTDYVGATKTVILDAAPKFTIVSGDGVKIPDRWPESDLSTADFPLILTRKGEGESVKVAGKTWGTDIFQVYGFVNKQHQSTYAASIATTEKLIQAFRDAYTDPNNFVLIHDQSMVEIRSPFNEALVDTGLIEMEFHGKDYYGFRFDVMAQEIEI